MNQHIAPDQFFWALQGICTLHRRSFSLDLARQQIPGPYTLDGFETAAAAYELEATAKRVKQEALRKEAFPLVAWMHADAGADSADERSGAGLLVPTIVLQARDAHLLVLEAGDAAPRTMAVDDFALRYSGALVRIRPLDAAGSDADADTGTGGVRRAFGFSWFLPQLLKYRKLWYEILLASLVIQLIALATPLFTQAIIDKVVVHRSESTLLVLAAGMALFAVFTALLSWLRQYLVLHTGTRVDAALGASVFERLFKLPPLYFQHRPTGVIAARLHGLETIREFIAGAAVTLVLDFPFLLIFVGIMFYYSVPLTLIVLAILTVIAVMSAIAGPIFQRKLQQQFMLGARNQAFLTEYIAGLETVKSLQMEPQLNSRYSTYLSSYLEASLATKQLANGYNTVSNLLEQTMGLLILGIGAYTVMHSTDFTIGMLVAFQMFSGRLSQPMLRMVGLWQQFQQARLSVERLGDLMNAPVEPYSLVPARVQQRGGGIDIEGIAFRYGEQAPLVYENLSISVKPGQTVGVMGPSGCGKSTLAKLMQGFYQPSAGRILLDGVDIRYLSANELRRHFGVVPQETVLFSGTIQDNLQMAAPDASFENIVAACKMAEIHGVIEALPQGYQTEIGERGAGLSGGQKQRIAIARALLKRPGILVFDEATSALDTATAEQFAQTVNALKGKVTILFITHGLPKGLQVDCIFRLGAQGAQRVLQPVRQPATEAVRS